MCKIVVTDGEIYCCSTLLLSLAIVFIFVFLGVFFIVFCYLFFGSVISKTEAAAFSSHGMRIKLIGEYMKVAA